MGTKLDRILKYASERNSFYIDIASRCCITQPHEIMQYPILTREMLQSNKSKLLSEEYTTSYLTNQLYTSSSSGTSGTPIEVLWDPSQYSSSMLGLWRRRKKYYNISPSDKHIDFMLKFYNNIPASGLRYSIINQHTISVNRLNLGDTTVLAELFLLLKNFQPVWLQISPSVMQMLINYCYTKNETLPQSVRYIEFLSEVLTSAVREQTERLIPGVKIANMYGSEEMNAIAYECPCGKMHVISENVLAECFDGEKISPYGEGRIILTNLHNRVNPLIRYDQGDEVTLSIETNCNCGYTDKLITSLSGRVSSSTVINGQRLSTCDVSDIMLIVSNKYGHPFMKYKFVYDSDSNSIMCYTVFNDEYINWRHEIWKTIASLFQTRYGNINMNFSLDDYDKNKYKQDLFVVI